MIARRNRVELPINAVNGNLIFTSGHAAAVHRVDSVGFDMLSLAQQLSLHGRLSTWAMKVERSFSIYRVCREYPADAYVDETVDMIDERYADRARWEAMLTEHADRMRSMRSFVPEIYAVISMSRPVRVPWSRQREMRVLRDAESAALDTLNDYLQARQATTHELQWMIRRTAVRGVCEPDLDPYWTPPALSLEGGVWEPGRADVQRFMPVVERRARHVLVEGEDGDSLQAFLVMGSLPPAADFPGAAELLFEPLERLDFPVDAVVHVDWLTNKKMRAICDNAIKDAYDEVDDASARFLDRRTRRRAQEVEDRQDYFASEPYPPGLDSFICFAVGAPSKDQLEERVKRLQRSYGSVRLYRPAGLQRELFEEHMLRPDGAAKNSSMLDYRRDYRRLLVSEQLAAMMPIGVRQGGSQRGIYLGYTTPGSRRPIKYDMLEASATNQAGAMLLNGTLGGGKTMTGQKIVEHAVNRGSIAVDVDPRPDHSLERLLGPERVHSISLENSDAYVGRLDPLVVAPPALREELAVSYMIDLLPQAVPEWQTAIIEAVRQVLREPRPSSKRVIDVLLSDQESRAVGRALGVWSEWGLCRMAFGDGSTADVDLAKPCTTIKSAGLSLPVAGTARASYDQSERISVATFKLIVAYAMRLLSSDVSVHKVLMLDEVHAFSDTSDGLRFLSRILRMARSMNVTVLMLTQLIGDLERLKDLIGVVMSFKQQNDDQARANLRMLGLDEGNEYLVGRLRGFSDGLCLMSGLDGRVVQMQVDPGEEFLRVADTNPTTRQLEAARA